MKKVLPTTRRVELIKKKEFVVVALDLDYEAFVVYVATLNISFDVDDKVYSSKKAQIAHLKVDESCIKFLSKYANFTDIFLSKLARKLSKYININDYAIELVND